MDGGATGFHDIWMVFLPPNVDECISPGACGTNAFGGYHSVMDLAGHQTIYAVIVDPSIEAEVSHGADPNGDPDAEAAIDAAGHETVEAMTDPEGTGWMDPNGFEVADKCEFGPQTGTPIGFQNNAPYNEAINGDNYLLQEMWSNQVTGGNGGGRVQSTSATSAGDGLPLPQINLTQFSHTITGDVNNPTSYGDTVTVDVYREDESGLQPADLVATAQAQSNATTGVWTVPLPNVSPGVPNAVGDDRDVITVDYSDAPNGSVQDATILTGSGGNPFTESGWTGWTDLDNGATVTNGGGSSPQVIVGPCFQTGVLTISGRRSPAQRSERPLQHADRYRRHPAERRSLGLGLRRATFTSNDNRAFSAPTSAFPGGLPRDDRHAERPGRARQHDRAARRAGLRNFVREPADRQRPDFRADRLPDVRRHPLVAKRRVLRADPRRHVHRRRRLGAAVSRSLPAIPGSRTTGPSGSTRPCRCRSTAAIRSS